MAVGLQGQINASRCHSRRVSSVVSCQNGHARMSWKLLYHRFDSSASVSPFDEAIVSAVRDDDICIACPYIGLSYLRRIARLSRRWRLVTDIAEWLASQNLAQRAEIASFVTSHQQSIRHITMLHAKVIIGSRSAVFGSANFTDTGITRRIELGVQLDSQETVNELQKWFDDLWESAHPVNSDDLHRFLGSLPVLSPFSELPDDNSDTSLLGNGRRRVLGHLAPIPDLASADRLPRATSPVTPEQTTIINAIRKLAPDRATAKKCLELLSRAIAVSGLSEDDPRIYTNSTARSIKVVINQRDVIDWKWHYGQPVLGLILDRDWLHHPATAMVHEIRKGTYAFKPRPNETDAPLWLRFPVRTLDDLPGALLLNWEACISREVTRGERSSYRKHHKREVWRMLVEDDVKEVILDACFANATAPDLPDLASLTVTDCDFILSRLDFSRDVRNMPDDRRRIRFTTGWQNATARQRRYSKRALKRLTWDNLGFRLGQLYGPRSKEEIIAVFEVFSTHHNSKQGT